MNHYYLSGWRGEAAPIIARVIEENKGKTEKEVRAALRLAYPFGERKYHPYKIWCDEVRKQLGPGPLSKARLVDPTELRAAFLKPRPTP